MRATARRLTVETRRLALLATLLIGISSAQATASVTVKSGNGSVGSTDSVNEWSSDGNTYAPAYVIDSHPYWSTIPGTSWIGGAADWDTADVPIGDSFFRATFTLPASSNSRSMLICAYTDDSATVSLNGNALGTANSLSSLSCFVAGDADLVDGDNVLSFTLSNGGGPAGLDYQATITTDGTATFVYSGTEQAYAVPAGVQAVAITAVGAPGSGAPCDNGAQPGGSGASVSATVLLPVGTTTLYVEVGGNPFNGGGAVYNECAASGGGASDVRTCSSATCALSSSDTRLVVAGGGGGGGHALCDGSAAGGNGGNTTITGAGDGGPGINSCDPASPGGDGGFGGDAGGSAGPGSYCSGVNGSLGEGGAGCERAGGGGGGYFGGGGGGASYPLVSPGGGGAGSSFWTDGAIDTSMSIDPTRLPRATIRPVCPVTCRADQCHVAGTCNPTTASCSISNAPDGTSCDDGNACTLLDECQSGTCVGSDPIAAILANPTDSSTDVQAAQCILSGLEQGQLPAVP